MKNYNTINTLNNSLYLNIRNKFTFMIFVIVILFQSHAKASIKEVELPLLSYHLKKDTFKDAPNKLDNNARLVLNPGLLVGFDTRKDTKTDGFSFIAKGGFLQDCANKTVYALGGGGRYREFISDKISFDINGYLMGANAVKDFSKPETLCTTNVFGNRSCNTYGGDNKRKFVLIPLINFGFNYHLQSNNTIGTTISYIPKNTAIAATSGSDLLFLAVNFGF